MTARQYTSMTLDDHRAAAREWSTVHRSVAEFENITRFGRQLPGDVHANVKRIRVDLDRIRCDMQEAQNRTSPGTNPADDFWQEFISTEAPATVRRATTVLTLDQHIAAARALGTVKPAILRFLGIVSDRRHLPVRVLDFGLRIERRIHAIRCAMDDVQYATLRGEDRRVDCWLGHFNYYDGDEAGSRGQNETILEGSI